MMLMVGMSYASGRWPLAVYSLSFWHYYLYALAYCYGSITVREFRRDALLTKAISLATLAAVYFSEPLSLSSLIVVATGFALNVSAVLALGMDRTYYGFELGQLAATRITRFPYGWISHPMLIGNIVAFVGTLLNGPFRHRWWPLAACHVSLNLGILLMEQYMPPRWLGERNLSAGGWDRRRWRVSLCWSVLVAVLLSVAVAMLTPWQSFHEAVLPVLGVVVLVAAYALLVCRRFTTASTDSDQRPVQS
jgi:hypothetical protein